MNFPKPSKTLLQLLGPSIVFVALSLNGGEMLLWPDLVSRYSLAILWPVPLILFLQFAVNLEIERYSVVTGKNTLSSMITKNTWLSPLFIFGIIISLVWPAWISVSGNILAYLLGFPSYGAWFAIGLLILQVFIWQSKASYRILENIAKVGLVIILIIGIYTIVRLSGEIGNIKLNLGGIWPANSDKITFLSALAFGGVAGVLNLVQSDWVANKGYGINQRLVNDRSNAEGDKIELLAIPNQESEKTDRNETLISEINWNKESVQNFKDWWTLIWQEHFVLFVVGNLIGIFLISVVGSILLPGSGRSGFGILTFEVDKLNSLFPFAGNIWGIAIFILFFMAQMTILDATGRLLKNTQNSFVSKFKSERLSQFSALLGLIILLFTAIIPGFNQPSGLLQISASASALIMALYPLLLLQLNLTLPKETRPKLFNILAVWSCVIFYGIMFVLAFI